MLICWSCLLRHFPLLLISPVVAQPSWCNVWCVSYRSLWIRHLHYSFKIMVSRDWKPGPSHRGIRCVLNAEQEGHPPSLPNPTTSAGHHISEKDKSSGGNSGVWRRTRFSLLCSSGGLLHQEANPGVREVPCSSQSPSKLEFSLSLVLGLPPKPHQLSDRESCLRSLQHHLHNKQVLN